MKLFKTILAGSALLLMISCQSGDESKGHSAYKAAQKQTGHLQKKSLKEAYIYYKKAVTENPTKITPLLKSRFIEMCLVRAEMMLFEGNAQMDGIPLFMADIDSSMTEETAPDLKNRYAAFLSCLADSSFNKGKLYRGLDILNKAITVAADKAPYEKIKQDKIGDFAKGNFESAEMAMLNAKANDNVEDYILAEFLVKVAMLQDPKYPGAQEMLSELYKKNRSTYSAYNAVVLDKPDTTVFKKVNNQDILLAVPTLSESGKTASLSFTIYSNTWRALRFRPDNFMVEDVNGNVFKALPSGKIEKDLLDQEMETKGKLSFKTNGAKLKKFIFETDDKKNRSEKFFL